MSKKHSLLFCCAFLLITLSNCKGQQIDGQQKKDTIPDWLSSAINEFEASGMDVKGQVDEYQYASETVYLVDFCQGCPDNLVKVYNKKGDIKCEFGGFAGSNSCPDFDSAAEFRRTVYTKK